MQTTLKTVSEKVGQWVSETERLPSHSPTHSHTHLRSSVRASKPKNLPINISQHRTGYVVSITRGSLKYRAFTNDLTEALALRDRFIAIHGAITGRGPAKTAHSNTGLAGVSETTHWHHSRPHPCFIVGLGSHYRRRIYYGRARTRAEALSAAAELRARLVAERYGRSADCQSAVSQVGNLRHAGSEVACG